MEEKLLKIINHFGLINQQRKLQEEVFELQEAITIDKFKVNLKHVKEEIADVKNILEEIQLYYNFTDEDIEKIRKQKVNRTIKRIETGYYDRKEE